MAGTGGARGMMEVMLFAEANSVQMQLRKIQNSLSPTGLAGFLAGPIHKNLQRRATRRFQGEGDSAVGQWAPLRQATMDIRQNMGFPAAHPINRRTGDLEEYITQTPANVSVGTWGGRLLFPGGRMAGDLLEKVGTAQSGKAYPNTQPRPVLGMDSEDMAQTLTALGYWIHTGGVSSGP